MPVYNAGDYLDESIPSILEQDYNNFEFIIIDDGSTDNSKEIILKWGDLVACPPKVVPSVKLVVVQTERNREYDT